MNKSNKSDFNHHPTVLYHSERIINSKRNISLQKSKFFPDVSVGYFDQQIDKVTGFNGWEVSLAIPLWFVPQRNEIKKSKIEYEKSKLSHDFAFKSLKRKYENANRKNKLLQSRLKKFETESLLNAESVVLTASKLYESGEIEYMEYIQHINNALDVKKKYLEALYEYNQTINLLNYFGN